MDPIEETNCTLITEEEDFDDEYDDTNDLDLDGAEFKCNFCNVKYEYVDELYAHIAEEHFEFECEICSKKFPSEKLFKQHKRNAHLGNKNIKCTICDATFSTKYNAQQHILSHSSQPIFECNFDNCNLKFRHLSSFRQHEKVHLHRNRKECPICHKHVTRYSLHMLTHADEKPFKCSICERTFLRKSALAEHEQIHSGILFTCDICDAAYTSKNSLYKHKQSYHRLEQFPCPVEECGKTFTRKDNLMVHMGRKHKMSMKSLNYEKRNKGVVLE